MYSLLLLTLATGDKPSISLREVDGPRRIEITLTVSPADARQFTRDGISNDAASKLLRVCVVNADGDRGPAVFAKYAIENRKLILRPRFSLLPGVTYLAIGKDASGNEATKKWTVPRAKTETPEVTAVYPSGETVPANCLKFTVHFSQPMREGRAIFEQIQIVDGNGDVVPDPWRRTELWSKDAKRVTMWIHPGRVKQGVNLREDFGPVLRPNEKYKLVVTAKVRSAAGKPLAKDFERIFRATQEDHTRVEPGRWKISSPRIKTRDPLTISFDKPLDHALASRMLSVHQGDTQVKGDVDVGKKETEWRFTPSQPWGQAPVVVRVDPRLEDLAGNTPVRVFDTDLRKPPERKPVLRLPVTLR